MSYTKKTWIFISTAVRTSNLVPFIAVQFILRFCVLYSKEMFGPWRLWDNILFRFLPRCLNKRCQTDHWHIYNDSYSHTANPWSLPSVLRYVFFETALADSQVSDSNVDSFANHMQCLFTANNASKYFTDASLGQLSSVFGVKLKIWQIWSRFETRHGHR